jgi:mRNA-degrading endonuclease RelE of RelBE toxin-antitoxin system
MKIQISKRFVKDTQQIADSRILAKIRKVLEETETCHNISDISGIEAMAGHPNFCRIKFDYRYRIGVYYEKDSMEFLRVGPRGDFYKKFP